MRHLQKFNEALEDNIYLEIQKMVDNNQFLKGKVKATKETVCEAGDFILLLDELAFRNGISILKFNIQSKMADYRFDMTV